jgi:hypothetical protein
MATLGAGLEKGRTSVLALNPARSTSGQYSVLRFQAIMISTSS